MQNPHPHFRKASCGPEHKDYSSIFLFSLGVITVLSAWKHCSTYCMLRTLFSGTQSTMTGTWKGSSVAMKEFTAFCRENSSLSVQPRKESGMLPLKKACSHRLNSCSSVNFRDRKSSSALQGQRSEHKYYIRESSSFLKCFEKRKRKCIKNPYKLVNILDSCVTNKRIRNKFGIPA